MRVNVCALAAIAAAFVTTATPASAGTVPSRPIDAGPNCYVYSSLDSRHFYHPHGVLTYNKCDGFSAYRMTPYSAPHLAPNPLPSSLSSASAGKRGGPEARRCGVVPAPELSLKGSAQQVAR
jgi:hypothetical protein